MGERPNPAQEPREQKEKESRFPYIAVIGAMGVGKTTFTKLVSERWKVPYFKEQFELNPYLDGFYHNPQEYSFRSEANFLIQKPPQIEGLKLQLKNSAVLHDTPWVLDYCYGRVHRRMRWLNQEEFATYRSLSKTLADVSGSPMPDIIIALVASDEAIRQRVRRRAEENPERKMELLMVENHPEYFGYLSRNVELLIRFFRRENGIHSVIVVDAEKYDFAYNDGHKQFIVRDVAGWIGRSIYLTNERTNNGSLLIMPEFCVPSTKGRVLNTIRDLLGDY